MAKTILALLPERRDQQLAREALGHHYHLWLAGTPARAVDFVRQGITPQLILSPVQSGGTTFLNLKEELSSLSPFRRAPFLVLRHRDFAALSGTPLAWFAPCSDQSRLAAAEPFS